MKRYGLGMMICVPLCMTAAGAKLDEAGVAAATNLDEAVICQIVTREAANTRVKSIHPARDWDTAAEILYASSISNPDGLRPEPKAEELTADLQRRKGTTKRDEIRFTKWLTDKVNGCDAAMTKILDAR